MSQSEIISSRLVRKGSLPKIPPFFSVLDLIIFRSPTIIPFSIIHVLFKLASDLQHYDFSLGLTGIYTFIIVNIELLCM
jgi:hypothetical protein